MNNNSFVFNVKQSNNFLFRTNELYDLYLPILCANSLALYSILYNLTGRDTLNSLTFDSKYCSKLLHCTDDELLIYRKELEAVGLIKTYQNKQNLTIILYSAKDFLSFHRDQQFIKLLLNKISQDDLDFLSYKYTGEYSMEQNKEISANFSDVFQEGKKIDFITEFKTIVDKIQKKQLLKVVIPQQAVQVINHYYDFYHLNWATIIRSIEDSLIIDNNQLVCQVSTILTALQNTKKTSFEKNNLLHRNHNIFKEKKCADYDAILSDYKNIDSYLYAKIIFGENFDEKIHHTIQVLETKYGLFDQVINVLLDFSLFQTQGRFMQSYLFKAAISFQGLNIDSCEKAIDYLHNFISGKRYFAFDRSSEQILSQINNSDDGLIDIAYAK